MSLRPEDIQQPRTPSQLVAFVDSVRANADKSAEERVAGHNRSGYYKEFFDEVIPLSKFAICAYPDNHTVKLILGNQGYDAEVRDGDGKLVDRIEIANPIDGKDIAKTNQELIQFGIGGFRIDDPGDDIEELMPIIARTATKKAIKDYSDSTVVFNVSGFPPLKGFESRYEEQVTHICQTLSAAGFKAKRVFVMLPTGAVKLIDG